MKTLTKENAETAKTIVETNHPEYGNWTFIFNGQPLNDGEFTHLVKGISGTKVLNEGEFRFWSIVE